MKLGHTDTTKTYLPFGKYRGNCLPEVPSSYLRYLALADFMEKKYPDLLEKVEAELEWRDQTDGHFEDDYVSNR
jgi:uncharacterized protein (DUF3820 family)